ncbi:MAG: glycosyltransferase [Clostridia bacterium]|nr:glycosyltransferase [Clostridia bacterium]
MMKLLHICCNLAGSTVFPQLFEALDAKGLEQEVFVPEKYASNVGKNQPKGVSTHTALTVRRSDAIFFFRKAQRSVPEIMRRVDMQTVGLIHAHTLFTDGWIAQALSEKTGVPYMVTLRYSDIEAIWTYMPHLRGKAREILRGAKRVVFLSPAARDKVLAQWLRGDEREQIAKKCAVIPNGIDPAWLDGGARERIGDPVRVGFAGILNDRKRPLDALEAVHEANRQQTAVRFALRACGDGPLREKLTAALLQDDEYLGKISGMDAMKAFYAGCDLLLLPSTAETFGMVYLEAMSQGVPVLYTKGQGFDGQFEGGEVGFAVKAGDAQDMARRLIECAAGYGERSARCIAHAKEYAWPTVAEKWMNLYREA